MANIRSTDTPAQTGPGIPDEAAGPEDPNLEAELEGMERELRRDEGGMFGEHPDGVGPTLGQDLDEPNPGQDLDDEDDEDDDGA